MTMNLCRVNFHRYRLILATICVATAIELMTGVAGAELPPQLQSITLGNVPVSLPEPSMPDGLDVDAQASVLKQVAGKYSLDRFTKESIVSPFTFDRETIKAADGERVGHRIDIWFVAHGQLGVIRDEALLSAMVESQDADEAGSGEQLSAAELSARGIKPPSGQGDDDAVAYHHFSVPVLKRVIVEGVVRGFSSSTAESHLAGVTLEDAFRDDPKYPNRWRHSDEEASEAVPYAGYAGYAKATQLIGYDNAILIECHAVVHEPHAWFNGANLLSSKMPIAVQDTVRRFRRALAKQAESASSPD